MVIPEPDDSVSQGEVESLLQCDQQQQMNHPMLSSLGRQASIYSLTLDEFQHTICEAGRNFWSMNMDEFLNNIWNAEEGINYTVNTTNNIIVIDDNNNSNNSVIDDNNSNKSDVVDNQAMQLSLNEAIISSTKGIARRHSLARAASLALPANLCLKTVDEVWSEIHGGVQDHGLQQQQNNNTTNLENNSKLVVQNSEIITRQKTFGEMTLEDFLIKAGIVREKTTIPVQQEQPQQPTTQQQQFGMQKQHPTTQQQQQPPTKQQQQQQPTTQQELQQQFGMYKSTNNPGNMSISFPTLPVILVPNNGGGAAAVVGPSYQAMPNGRPVMVEPSMYSQQQLQPVCFGGRVGNGGGYGSGQSMGMVAAPLSPVTSEGMCGTSQQQQVDRTVGMRGQRGKKRILESGTVEKVVERRQRRMIKNRESAARSRARKQAYTVELEAELNNLKEENNNLKQALEEIESNRKQQFFEELEMRACTHAQKTKDKMRSLRKNLSCLM
ncbi:hypothetical protein Ddye_008355 [Dipteronia dyeriana]|uniref:BZIP domain-containing protein n=1 Tax=Dipteronia dyeriana TaxID=168575 RepID=A0AAE0CLU0_9ROSI|nr:hypothetical protein Ddye_008355 [Dipteronia dyeriana]